MNYGEKLAFLQELKELEFSELVLVPLLEAMGYTRIQLTHGPSERGKDLLFSRSEPLDIVDGLTYLVATVKARRLSGSVSKSASIREVYYQASQCLTEPYIHPYNGTAIAIDRVYVINTYPISPVTVDSIRGQLAQLANRVFFVGGPELVALIDQYAPTLLSSLPNPEARYLNVLARRFLNDHVLGQLGHSRALSIVDIYTGGDLSPTTPADAIHISFAFPETSKQKLWLADIRRENRHLAIIADVGSGKTTLLHKITLDVAALENYLTDRLLPIYIPLHGLPAKSLIQESTFLAAVEHYVREDQGFPEFSLEAAKDRVVLLLDGFDELPSSHREVADYLPSVAKRFPEGLIVTSRPTRIPDLPTPFAYFKLNPFDDQAINEFIGRWFASADEHQKELKDRIMSDPTVRTFCRSPLLLTLICILARRYSVDELPNRKTAIYERITELLLGEWDVSRRIENRFSWTAKSFVLENLALDMHENHRKQFTEAQLMEHALSIFSAKRVEEDPALLFAELFYRSSLLRQNLAGVYEFAHLSFQEFFAARGLTRLGIEGRIQVILYDDWWRNVLAFYFGIRRSMAGVTIGHSTLSHGRSIRLIEFLGEADYTDIGTRQKALRGVARDLLFSGPLSRADLETCARGGEELASQIADRLATQGSQGNITNYLRLLLALSAEFVSPLLLRATPLLLSLTRDELRLVLREGLSVVRLNKNEASFFFEQAVSAFAEGTRSAGEARSDIGFLRELSESIEEKVKLRRFAEGRARETMRAVFQAAREIAFRFPAGDLRDSFRDIAFPGGDAEIASILTTKGRGGHGGQKGRPRGRGHSRPEVDREKVNAFWALTSRERKEGDLFRFRERDLRRACEDLRLLGLDQEAFARALRDLEQVVNDGTLLEGIYALLEVKELLLEDTRTGLVGDQACRDALKKVLHSARRLGLRVSGAQRDLLRAQMFPGGDGEILFLLSGRGSWPSKFASGSALSSRELRQIDDYWPPIKKRGLS